MWLTRISRASPDEAFVLGMVNNTVCGISSFEVDADTGLRHCVSVVASGGYEDDSDGIDTFVYTGAQHSAARFQSRAEQQIKPLQRA